MKQFKNVLGTLLAATLLFSSCTKNDDSDMVTRATAEDFNNLREVALENLTQNFQFNANDGSITLTSQKGVEIIINGACLTLNGNAVTGEVDLEFVEIFKRPNDNYQQTYYGNKTKWRQSVVANWWSVLCGSHSKWYGFRNQLWLSNAYSGRFNWWCR